MGTFDTEGIVLQKIDYSETSLIIKMYTLKKGLQSFIFQGAKRKNKKGQLVSSLAILSFTYFQRKDNELAKISGVELSNIYKNIPFDPIKSSVVFFINEVLLNTIKEEETNPELFLFIKHSLQVLDAQSNISLFPSKFLLELLKHLGYFPRIESNGCFFDYLNGKISKNQPNHPNYMDEKLTKSLLLIINEPLTHQNLHINYTERQMILNGLLDYYKAVLGEFKKLKSLDVLEAILS